MPLELDENQNIHHNKMCSVLFCAPKTIHFLIALWCDGLLHCSRLKMKHQNTKCRLWRLCLTSGINQWKFLESWWNYHSREVLAWNWQTQQELQHLYHLKRPIVLQDNTQLHFYHQASHWPHTIFFFKHLNNFLQEMICNK